jgi:acyl carrier protein
MGGRRSRRARIGRLPGIAAVVSFLAFYAPVLICGRHGIWTKSPRSQYDMSKLKERVLMLPLTPSGKLDREALMRAPMPNNSGHQDHEPPATPLEQMLAAHWSNLLGLEQVGVNDDFFHLGGHSLMATRIIARVHSELGVRVPVRSLFSAPTIRQFARAIVQQIAERIKAAQSRVLVTKLEESILRTAA